MWRSGGWASARVWALVCARVSIAPSPTVLSASWGSAIAGLPPAEEAAWKAELTCAGGGLAGTSTPLSLEGDRGAVFQETTETTRLAFLVIARACKRRVV